MKQSPVEAKLIKDGKALGVKEVETIVTEEKVTFKIKKALRAMSGTYQIKLTNAQGDGVKDIFVNIQGIRSYYLLRGERLDELLH